MVKVRTEPYRRDTENYSIRPEEKAMLWEQIIEAAQVVIERGGADIRFVPPIDDSERFYREQNIKAQKWLRKNSN